MTNTYSQSICEYECAIQKGIQQCGCIPWNIPRTSMDDPNFCDFFGNYCFNYAMESVSFSECNCPADCTGTYFSVFESIKPFENPGIIFFFLNFMLLSCMASNYATLLDNNWLVSIFLFNKDFSIWLVFYVSIL